MSSERTDVLIRRCRKRGGDCPCKGESCEAFKAIDAETVELNARRAVLDERLDRIHKEKGRLLSPFAEFKAGFDPTPPDGYRMTGFFDDEGAYFAFERESDDDHIPIDEWPFDRDYVYADDCRRLGIEIV